MGPTRTAEERARAQARYLTGFVWHLGVFVIVNAFFWLIDLGLGADGVQWAYWITAPWAFALAFHALAYLVAGRDLEERKTREYLADQDRDRSDA